MFSAIFQNGWKIIQSRRAFFPCQIMILEILTKFDFFDFKIFSDQIVANLQICRKMRKKIVGFLKKVEK